MGNNIKVAKRLIYDKHVSNLFLPFEEHDGSKDGIAILASGDSNACFFDLWCFLRKNLDQKGTSRNNEETKRSHNSQANKIT